MRAHETVENGGTARAVAALMAVRGAGADASDDLELCVFDFARCGLTGGEALDELLAIRAGVPIVISSRRPAGAAAPQAVRGIVRRAGDPGEFRLAVRRLRRTGGRMYLRLEI